MAGWTPGHRRAPTKGGANPMYKRITGHASLGQFELATYEGTRDELGKEYGSPNGWTVEEGHSILLRMRAPGGVFMSNLTAMTEKELDVFKEFILEAVESARPFVQERDATAREAEERGDYSYARSNRSDPKVVRGKRKS